MIHRPPDSDFVQFQSIQKSEPSGLWVLNLLAFFAIGAAVSGIVSGFRGWSSHSHID